MSLTMELVVVLIGLGSVYLLASGVLALAIAAYTVLFPSMPLRWPPVGRVARRVGRYFANVLRALAGRHN